LILQNLQPDIAGEYRDVQVYVEERIPTPSGLVPIEMEQLLEWTPDDSLEALEWHIAFEQIHPFADGNGRIGRIVYLWQCTSLLDCTPILWRADDRQGYYDLFASDVDPSEKITIEE